MEILIDQTTMKILFVNTDIGYGGAEKMMVWLANQCAKSGHSVVFFTYRDDCVMQPLSKRVKHKHVQIEKVGGELSLFKTTKYLHKYIKEERFDIAIAFLSPSILRLAIAAFRTNIKLLFSHRADPYYRARNKKIRLRVYEMINRWAFNQADYYVFQTSIAQAYFDEKIQNHSSVIANPIHPLVRTVERKGNVEKKIVTVGRLDLKQKRQDVLIDAFNLISSKYPNYILEIYGSGDDYLQIRRMINNNVKIKLMGRTNQVSKVIQNAAVFVLSSDFEGIPNALLEAMSIGVPCVATDCSPGGASLLIQNKKNGLLVPRDNPLLLAEAISYMLDNEYDAEQMATEAMHVNETYSEDIISGKWINLIGQLVVS